jgi:hypothetical protein
MVFDSAEQGGYGLVAQRSCLLKGNTRNHLKDGPKLLSYARRKDDNKRAAPSRYLLAALCNKPVDWKFNGAEL